jgi:hypothetical protein
MLILAISGKQRTGKTYCATQLVDNHHFKRMSFAGPLKDDIRAMGFPETDIYNKPPYMRALMQTYGQARRAVDPNHWVNALYTDLSNLYMLGVSSPFGYQSVVIDDVRFPNEIDMLRDFADNRQWCEFRAIRMKRTGEQAEDASHAEEISETALDGRDDWWQVFPVAGGDYFALDRAAANMARP